MGSAQGKRDRGNRDRRTKLARPRADPTRYVSHPLYGGIPLVPRVLTDPGGREHTYWDYDPDYQPPMPAGAVAGDIRKQHFCHLCYVPRYFYVDAPTTCVQCGEPFVFSAKEQKYWYETLGFYFASVAIRCPRCRRQRRTEKVLREQIAAAKEGLRSAPSDPGLLLGLAQAIVGHHERTGKGNLNEAIAACRKARRLSPRAHQCLFWEALCHLQAGHREKALALLRQFIESPRLAPELTALRKRAMSYLNSERVESDKSKQAPEGSIE